MSPCEVLKDLFFIERGYLNGNHFVYRSRTPVLIDSAYVADYHETEKLLTSLGVNPSDIRLIVNTHCHCDHVGGNKVIQEKSGCDIALHKVGKYFIDTRDDWSTWWKYYAQEAEFFNCTNELEDGEVVAIGPYEFRVIYTPGHAADGIVLYNQKEKILISSDTLWENEVAVVTMRVEGSNALFNMQESLERLEALEVKIVYPGHGRPFTDFKKALAQSQERIKKYMQNQDRLGNDVLKKIIIYTLLMKKAFPEDAFFGHLMGTYWFKETVDLYFNGEYETKYKEIMHGFIQRGIVKLEDHKLVATVKP